MNSSNAGISVNGINGAKPQSVVRITDSSSATSYNSQGRASSELAPWEHWGPTIAGEVSPCFKGGFLYRIFNKDTKVWALYNDTFVYEMHASFVFPPGSKVAPIGSAVRVDTESTGEVRFSVVVYPMETVEFLVGERMRHQNQFNGKALSVEFLRREREAAEARVAISKAAVASLAASSPCFSLVDAQGTAVSACKGILALCRQHKVRFVDPDFPPETSSLNSAADLPRRPQAPDISPCGWLRPTDYLPEHMHSQLKLFGEVVRPQDVERGDLSDAWVVSAIAALAELPGFVESMFGHSEPKDEAVGAYSVLLNRGGLWENVIVDDFLPVLGCRPRFARIKGEPVTMWASYLEKAYAKRKNGYRNISIGDPLFALRDFTGYPTTRLEKDFAASKTSGKDGAALFQRLCADYENGHLIVLSTPGKADERSARMHLGDHGLLAGYAYAVVYITSVAGFDLVLVRNPWRPATEWKGRWCAGSDNWEQYPSAAAAFPTHDGSDGAFVAEWSEVLAAFASCGVLFNHDRYSDYRVRSTFRGGIPDMCVEITVTEPTTLTLMLSQADHCGTAQEMEDYSPILMSIAGKAPDSDEHTLLANSVADAGNSNTSLIFLQGRDVGAMYTFLPERSPYLVIPRRLPMPTEAEDLPFVLGILSQLPFTPYGQAQVRIKKLAASNNAFGNYVRFVGDAVETTTSVQIKKSSHIVELSATTLNS